ncbi:Fructosamine kinase-domain-containing protein [Hypoxylon argillaceum]|nr:Fructosamine kinase-domain-containing protein [Hypoxylon argillaceum]
MANEHTDYKGEVDVPVEAIQIIDPEVVAKLPPGTNASNILSHGSSLWTRTARLNVELGGVNQTYFLKTSFGERGKKMMSGEFYCMMKIYDIMPDFVPRPISWGTYSSIPDVHFFLCDFRPMTNALPDLENFPAKVAAMHHAGVSPNGKFGFDVTTFHGNTPIEHGWSETWEEYFKRTTRVLFELEQEAQGPNEQIKTLMVPFFEKVIPRLLRPLETGGRSIQPSLIHGDLWHGNTSTDGNTGLPIIFDAASFYAHNEYELGVWRQPWNEINKSYRMRYYEHFPKSQPEGDYDDRNALYAIRVNILDSILYEKESGYRNMLIQGMQELIDKFPGGFEAWQTSSSDASES